MLPPGLLPLLMLLLIASLANADDDHAATTTAEEHVEPAVAILFPWCVALLGVVLFFVLSRTAPWLPYTAVLFLMGTLMGVGVSRRQSDNDGGSSPNLLHASMVHFWLPIDSEVLLLVFLPGLIFSDAASQNTHLFQVAFSQCLVFAFPMVLAGTVLTACVAYYIFPYDWSFYLSMTFGAILAATDPVAVAALLNEVGAPPRLKVHIAGESLLNDGSAIVFFTIFQSLYLLELKVPGLGEAVDLGLGVNQFFRKAAGGAAIGIFFGLGLLAIMSLLSRRLNREENVTEVALSIVMAYVCYFTAEVVWETSGVISVVVLGVMSTAFGKALINDHKLYEDFWSLVEWLLNTVLFSLGGLVWGSVISNSNEEIPGLEFTARDWGYLFLLYFLLMAIRFFLFAVSYPLISRIGLKSSWQEMVFQSFGGLRGAVGIALAISLDNIVKSEIGETDDRFAVQTNKLFGFVGGIAFLTLVVNGVVAGPFLRLLGLAKTTAFRKRMLSCFRSHARQHAIDDLVQLLSQRRFKSVNFAVVRHHVPILQDLTMEELIEAAQNLNQTDMGTQPELRGVTHYLSRDQESDEMGAEARDMPIYKHQKRDSITRRRNLGVRQKGERELVNDLTLQELRMVFLELVRSRYQHQINTGELAEREFVTYSLDQSLDLASDLVSKGEPLGDFDFIDLVNIPISQTIGSFLNFLRVKLGLDTVLGAIFGELAHVVPEDVHRRVQVERCIAFISAHLDAQNLMKEQFMDTNLSKAEEQVIAESEGQVKRAEEELTKYPSREVQVIVSHKVCKIILNNLVEYEERLVESGLVKNQESEEYLGEVQESLTAIDSCAAGDHHPGEVAMDADDSDPSQPGYTISISDLQKPPVPTDESA